MKTLNSDSNQQRNPVPLPKISFEQPERQSQCVDFDRDGICKFIVHANGTRITGPISLTTADANFVGENNENRNNDDGSHRIAIATVTSFASVCASHSADPITCEGDGLYDGKNNPFSQEYYEMCGQIYYDAFIEGCMSVNNTREACEMATDAGNGNHSTESAN